MNKKLKSCLLVFNTVEIKRQENEAQTRTEGDFSHLILASDFGQFSTVKI